MRVDSELLPQHLKGALKPLYTVLGDEPLLALEAGDRLRARARAEGYSEREVLTVEQGFDWARLGYAANALSLFATRRLIELRIPNGKPGREGGEALAAYANALPPDTVTVVALPRLDWQAKKAQWLGALEQAGIMVDARIVERGELPRWLSQRLALQSQSADEETLRFIADRVEGNLLAAFQEVKKLALLLPPGKLAFDQVKEAVLDVARFDVFKLGEALLAGDARHFIRMMDGLKGEGAGPPLVLWAITEEIRALLRLAELVEAGRPMESALRDARIWGPRKAFIQRAVARFSVTELTAALGEAARVDRLAKGIGHGDLWEAMLALGLRLARPQSRPAVRRRESR